VTVIRLEAWCDNETEEEYRDELTRSSLPTVAKAEALEQLPYEVALSERLRARAAK
jgi:hypothetical protein